MLFRSFVAFSIFANVNIRQLSLSEALSYLEFLVDNRTTAHMVSNHVSAIRAMFVLYDIPYQLWDHPKIKYFIKSIKMARPLALPKKNIIDLNTLKSIIAVISNWPNSVVYKAVFLTAFFGFFRLSNIAPHAISEFDITRHFTGGDIFFQKDEVQLLLKWSKTMQYRNDYKLVSLPKLGKSTVCPYRALRNLMHLYAPDHQAPLFQIKTVAGGWQVLTDSRIRKTLANVNQKLRLPKNYYTFHAFRRSGATLAYEMDVPIKEIKDHGTWASDCAWTYIRPQASAGHQVAQRFRRRLKDM